MSEIGRARAVMVEGTVTLGLRCARLRDDAALGRTARIVSFQETVRRICF
ncbi:MULTISPECIES: hypothetical protein [Burkholderia]|nr:MULTISPECIES: hypothetical protein [Burkholderia]